MPQVIWELECIRERGRVLRGPYCHYCDDWDGLTVDATTPEFACCGCYSGVVFRAVRWISAKYTTWKMGRAQRKVQMKEAEFCLFCGAGVGKHRRNGEGTCPKCDPEHCK